MADKAALIILDMVSTFAFPNGASLARSAKTIAPTIARLRARMTERGHRCIFVNDALGEWDSNFPGLLDAARRGRGSAVLDHLLPGGEDEVVFKPKHSAFFASPLASMIGEVSRVVITGVSAESCVLATAMDAHMRDLRPLVVSDGIGSIQRVRRESALKVMRLAEIDTCRAAGVMRKLSSVSR